MLPVTETLPPPPYPPDVKARGWSFDLDVERIEASDTWALAGNELQPWLLKTWYVAWKSQQVGSMLLNHVYSLLDSVCPGRNSKVRPKF